MKVVILAVLDKLLALTFLLLIVMSSANRAGKATKPRLPIRPASIDAADDDGEEGDSGDEEDDVRGSSRNRTLLASNVTFLLNNLLKDYDNSLRPDLGGPPLQVEINMQVRSMGPISEMDMSYSMDCYFRQSWVDKRLAYSGQKNLALNIEMLRKIWKPDTYIYNGRKSYLHTITTPNKFMRLSPNGRVLYSQRLTIKASCQMDLSDFPMDKQRCPLLIGSYGYTVRDVKYEWTSGRGVNIASDMKLSQFDLITTPTGNATMALNKGNHSTLMVSFHLQRHMGNFIIQVYGPCVLLVVISWVSFWLNREATSDRISLGATTVLTMIFLGLEARTDLPQVSYPTALDYFVFLSFMFILATVTQFALVHYFTKLGAGEYYLEELEETICYLELRRKMVLERRYNRLETEVMKNSNSSDEISFICNYPPGTGSHSHNHVAKAESRLGNHVSETGSCACNHASINGSCAFNHVSETGSALFLPRSAISAISATSADPNVAHSSTRSFLLEAEDDGEDLFHNHAPSPSEYYDHAVQTLPHFRSSLDFRSSVRRNAHERNYLNHHPYSSRFFYSKKSGRCGKRTLWNRNGKQNSNHVAQPPSRSSRLAYLSDDGIDGNACFSSEDEEESSFPLPPPPPPVRNSNVPQSSAPNPSSLIADRKLSDMEQCGCKRCITRAMNNPEKALNSVSRIDKISRVVFPLAFLVLNFVYWYKYLRNSERIDLSFESS